MNEIEEPIVARTRHQQAFTALRTANEGKAIRASERRGTGILTCDFRFRLAIAAW